MSLDIKKFLGFATEEIVTKVTDDRIVKANAYLAGAKNLILTGDEQRDQVKAMNSLVYEKLKVYKKEMKADIDAAEAPVKRLKQKRKDLLDPTDTATKLIASKVLAYDDEKRRVREEVERKKREEAELERARLQAIENEKAAKIAAEQLKIANAKIEALKKIGQEEAAEKLAAQADEIKAEPVQVATVVEVDPQEALAKIREADSQTGQDDFDVEILNIHLVPDEYVKKELRLGEVKKRLRAYDGKVSIAGLAWTKKRIAKRN